MSNTSTDPAGFDSEATGAFRVGSLADSVKEREPVLTTAPAGPSLVYVHSTSGCQTLIDRMAPTLADDSPDDRLRELAVARALLVHALRLVDRELNR